MNRDFDEELGRRKQESRRRDENSARPRSRRAGYGTAGGDYRSEQELWEERKRQHMQLEEEYSEADKVKERTEKGRSRGAASNGRNVRSEEPKKQESAERRTSRRESGTDGSGLSSRKQAQIQKKKKRRRIITMIVAECIALVLIFGYGFMARTMAKIQRPNNFSMDKIATNEISEDVAEQMKGYWTIALFGVDSRGNVVTKGTNADVNIICNINRDTGEIKLVSVYRDTYLNVSKEGSYNKLNYAYAVGGPEQAIETLNRNLDLEINDYMTFNWKAVANAIDILGGVDIELSKAEFYYINSFITETVKATGIGSHQLTHAGMNHLDGVQAVAYGRLRLMDTDFARTERQRKIIKQAFEKAKKADFQTLYVLIGTVFPQVSTSIWVDDIVSNAKNISKFHLGETTGFPQARGNANIKKKGDVVVPATLESNVKKLHEFLYGNTDYTPSDTVKKISGKIASDTGIYKEGQYVDKVGTDGGVIQPPKTKPAATEAESTKEPETSKESSENESSSSTGTDGQGNQSESTGRDWIYPTETDAQGNVVYPTDEDGNYITLPAEHPTAGTGTSSRPGESTSGSIQNRPGESTSGSVQNRPGESTSGSSQNRPGESTSGSSQNRPGESTSGSVQERPGTVVRPGETSSEPQTSEAIRPTAPGGTTSSRPEGNINAPGPMATTGAQGNGGPGGGQSENTGGPGSSSQNNNPTIAPGPGGVSSSSAGTGVVAGPGQ